MATATIEARGIDRVPLEERHGKPSDLFWVWAAANVNYLYIVLGGLLMVFGLNVWQGLAVVVVGNLFWAAIGLLAVSGPAAGTPSSVVTRSMFGIRGNRVYTGVFSWPTFIAYEAINLSLGALAGFAFADQLGVSPNRPVQVLVVVVAAAVTLVISVYGHATILRMSGLFTALLAVSMLVLGVSVLAKADWGYDPTPASPAAPCGRRCSPASRSSRPLRCRGASPRTTRATCPLDLAAAVAGWTALGGFLPAVTLGASASWPAAWWTWTTRRAAWPRSSPAGSTRCSC